MTKKNKQTDKQIVESLNKSTAVYDYGWSDYNEAGENAKLGLDRETVKLISSKKNEPEWMLEYRLRAYDEFVKRPLMDWGVDLRGFDFENFKYYVDPIGESSSRSDEDKAKWESLPENIRNTYDKLGIPTAERDRLVSGVAAQYESEIVYNKIREDLAEQGVVFLDTSDGLKKYPDIFKKYFGKIIKYNDNKFSLLNSAVWSGGSFVYVPKNVKVKIPLQAYFRLNTQSMGQFERTLIIADDGADVTYIEGCTAPIYSQDSLHSGVVEIYVGKNAHVRYTTIQNWSTNVYNLVTQRAYVEENGYMEWVDGNIGSKATMKYPACVLAGEGAKAETLSLTLAGSTNQTHEGVQQQDTGAKMIHLAPNTSSSIVSKSVSRNGGRSSYRGLVKIVEGAKGSSANVVCDALLIDNISRTDTYPYSDIRESDVSIGHEASVSKINEDQLFYLMARGIEENEALAMIVRGFIEPIAKQLPMEYALELNRLIELQMEDSVG